MGKDHCIEPDFFPVELHRLVLDNAFISQSLYPSPAGRLRQPDRFADRRRIDSGRLLQDFEDSTVYLINRYILHNRGDIPHSLAFIMHTSAT